MKIKGETKRKCVKLSWGLTKEGSNRAGLRRAQ